MRHATFATPEYAMFAALMIAQKRGRRAYVVECGPRSYRPCESEPSPRDLKLDGETLYAECFPGGRIVLWGEAVTL